MRFPLVTRRRHDAETEALRAEIETLVRELIGVCNDLTTTKASLREALGELRETKAKLTMCEGQRDRERRRYDWAMERVAANHPLSIPLYPPQVRIYDESRPAYRDTYFVISVAPFAYQFGIDLHDLRRFEDRDYVVDYVAHSMGIQYGRKLTGQVKADLGKAVSRAA